MPSGSRYDHVPFGETDNGEHSNYIWRGKPKPLLFTWSVSRVSIIGQLSLHIIFCYLSDFPHTSTLENIVEQCLFTSTWGL